MYLYTRPGCQGYTSLLLTLYYLLFTTYSLLQARLSRIYLFTTYSSLLTLYYLLFTTGPAVKDIPAHNLPDSGGLSNRYVLGIGQQGSWVHGFGSGV